MTKKISLITIFIILVLTLCSCVPQSEYDSLTEEQKGIVDSVLSHSASFSDCNAVRFSNYNGNLYFVAFNMRTSGNTSARLINDTKYYIVTSDSFIPTTTDAYSSQTAYGAMYDWDDDWDVETKREKLSTIIK